MRSAIRSTPKWQNGEKRERQRSYPGCVAMVTWEGSVAKGYLYWWLDVAVKIVLIMFLCVCVCWWV